jgi:hypothetical protein
MRANRLSEVMHGEDETLLKMSENRHEVKSQLSSLNSQVSAPAVDLGVET